MAQAAKRLTTSTSRRNATAKPRPVPASGPETYPDQYAKRVRGHCMEPAIADGSCVLVDKTAAYGAGDLVVIYLRPEAVAAGSHGVLLKRVVMPMFGRVTLPYRASPLSNVMPLMLVEQDNPPRQYALPADWLLAVHRCLGSVPPDMEVIDNRSERLSAGGDALSRRAVVSGLGVLTAAALSSIALAAPAVEGLRTKDKPMNMLTRTPDASHITPLTPSADDALTKQLPALRDAWRRWSAVLVEYSEIDERAFAVVGKAPREFTPEAAEWCRRLHQAQEDLGIPAVEDRESEAADSWTELADAFLETPATTFNGLRLKLEVCDGLRSPIELIDAVKSDVERVTGRPLVYWSGAGTGRNQELEEVGETNLAVSEPQEGPIEQIIDEHFAIGVHLDNYPGELTDDESNRLSGRQDEIEEVLLASEVTTAADCAALLRFAIDDTKRFRRGGLPEGDGDNGEKLTYLALTAALRLLGGAA